MSSVYVQLHIFNHLKSHGGFYRPFFSHATQLPGRPGFWIKALNIRLEYKKHIKNT